MWKHCTNNKRDRQPNTMVEYNVVWWPCGYEKLDIFCLVSLQLTLHVAGCARHSRLFSAIICPISSITSIRQPEVGTVHWTVWIANIAIFYGNESDITIFWKRQIGTSLPTSIKYIHWTSSFLRPPTGSWGKGQRFWELSYIGRYSEMHTHSYCRGILQVTVLLLFQNTSNTTCSI